jgi:hypothetical protein
MVKLRKGSTIILFVRQATTKNGLSPGIKMMSLLRDFGAATVDPRKENTEHKFSDKIIHKIRLHYLKTCAGLIRKALDFDNVNLVNNSMLI